MRRVAPVGLLAVALAGCGESDGSAPVAPATAEIVEATADAAAIDFSIEVTSGDTVVLAADGQLDIAPLAGHRADAAGLSGGGLEPIAEVWLADGRLHESTDGGPAKPIDGDMSDFLGIDDPTAPATLEDVLANWLGDMVPQVVGEEQVDGIEAVHLVVDRPNRADLDVWVDNASRLVRVIEVDDGEQPLSTIHAFRYPATVEIPPLPAPSGISTRLPDPSGSSRRTNS